MVVAAVLAGSGCVTVEMPKHMVSDAVGAGKDLYRSVDKALRKTPPKLGELESNSEGSEFWLVQPGSRQASVGELERGCLDDLVTRTRQRVGVEKLEYRVVNQRVEAREENVVVRCQIVVEVAHRGGA